MKTVLTMLVMSFLLTSCAGQSSIMDMFSSGALGSCYECFSDLTEEKADNTRDEAVKAFMADFGK